MTRRVAGLCAASVVLGAVGVGMLEAQQAAPAVKKNTVLQQDMTIPGREAIMAEVEFPPGSAEGRHTHPAAELFGFVVEGTVEFEIEGKATATLKAGDHFYVAPGKVHQALNRSQAVAKTYVVFVAEQGKPLTAPAP